MRDGFYHQTGRVEGRHWWFRHRRRLVTSLLDREISGPPGDGARALEVGCGTGGNLETIERRGYFTVGIDRSPLALELARKGHPDAALACIDANRLGDCFPSRSFDLVTVLNVLYHRWIASELAILEQVRRLLRPGGRLLVTEPAFESLRRRHDRVDYGARRYRRRQLVELVNGAGFTVKRATYFNTVALGPAAIAATIDRLGGAVDREARSEQTAELTVPPAPVNWFLFELCRVEAFWLRSVGDLPLGVGIVLLARAEGES